MRPPIEFLSSPDTGIQLMYSFVIILCSLMIYFSTKEMEELSSYKGIKFFRKAFLFFAIAYFFRYFIAVLLTFFGINEILKVSPLFVGIISLFIFLYSSIMAVFYLSYSGMWKKINHTKIRGYLLHVVAIIIALIGTVFASNLVYFIINILLLIFVTINLIIINKDANKKGRKMIMIYTLLFIFWVLNIIDILIPKFLQLFQLIIYLASISLFMAILYKVLKRVGD
jgi:hypothetical protein